MTPIFPAGAAGAGLLALRLAVTISLLALTSAFTSAGDWRHMLAIICAIALCTGLQTRVAAALSLMAAPYAIYAGVAPALTAVHVATGLALCLIGPGAFSTDARFFGRRKLRLPQSRTPGE